MFGLVFRNNNKNIKKFRYIVNGLFKKIFLNFLFTIITMF